MFKKFLILSIFLLYQTNVQSKSFDQKNFNQRYLSNYFSALVSFDNVNNERAIKYYNSSKSLISQHETFLKNYIFSLVEIGDVKKAIREISNNKNTNNSNFFEAYVILIVDAINKKDFLNAKIYIEVDGYLEEIRRMEVQENNMIGAQQGLRLVLKPNKDKKLILPPGVMKDY